MTQLPYLIGIAGPSGAGKSFLAEHLAQELRHAILLSIDAYYPDLGHLSHDERAKLNFDDPGILDTRLLFAQVAALSHGEPVRQPVYDFANHTRTEATQLIEPAPFVIIEGLFTLYWPELRNLLRTRVYVDTPDPIALDRRIARDVHERGRTPEYVEHQFQSSVVPMAELYVRPTAQFADVVLSGASDIREEVQAVVAHVRRSA